MGVEGKDGEGAHEIQPVDDGLDVSISIPINCPPDYCHFAGLNASDVPNICLLFVICFLV